MKREEIKALILELLEEQFDINPADIDDSTTLKDLKMSSLDIAELMMMLEEEKGIELNSFGGIVTFSDLLDSIERTN